MSKLLDKLKNLNKSSLPTMGFRRPDREEKSLSMLVLAELSGRPEAEAKEIADCGVAGTIFDSVGLSAAALSRYIKNTNGIAAGLAFTVNKAGNGYKLISDELDFLVFNVNLPVTAFEGKEIEHIGKILRVEASVEAGLLRSVHNVYPGIDAVMIDLRVTPLTMESLMNCRRVLDFSGQPVIALVNKSLATAELLALRESGVKALVVPQDASVEEIKSLIDAVASLPRQENRMDKKDIARLPKLGMFPSPKEESGDDGDDDNDDDDE